MTGEKSRQMSDQATPKSTTRPHTNDICDPRNDPSPPSPKLSRPRPPPTQHEARELHISRIDRESPTRNVVHVYVFRYRSTIDDRRPTTDDLKHDRQAPGSHDNICKMSHVARRVFYRWFRLCATLPLAQNSQCTYQSHHELSSAQAAAAWPSILCDDRHSCWRSNSPENLLRIGKSWPNDLPRSCNIPTVTCEPLLFHRR